MEVFNLSSIFSLVAATVFLFASVKMYFVSREQKDNISILYYFYGLSFITAYLFVNGLPGILLEDSYSVLVITAIFRPLLLLGGMFLCLIPINLLKAKIMEIIYPLFVVLSILASSILTFMGVNEAGKTSLFREVGHWIRPENEMISYGILIVGVIFVISLAFTTLYYFWFAAKKRDNQLYFGKSVMMGIGSFFLLLGVVSNYMIGVSGEIFVITSIIASLFFIMGAVSFVASVTYKGEDIKISYKLK